MTEADRAAEAPPPLHLETGLADRLADATGLLLALDFDGTLAPVVEDPDAAAMTADCRSALRRLATTPGVRVAVVSGRALEDLRGRVDLDGVAYAGNHGLELHRDGHTAVHPLAARCRPAVRALVDRLRAGFADVEGCHVEAKDLTATVHYRRAAVGGSDVERAVRRAVEQVAPDRVRVGSGKDIVELRPDIPWDKGNVVRLLAEERDPGWLSVYVGDDTTDEDAFRVLADAGNGLGVHVGTGATAATRHLPDVEAVERALTWLARDGLGALRASTVPGDAARLEEAGGGDPDLRG